LPLLRRLDIIPGEHRIERHIAQRAAATVSRRPGKPQPLHRLSTSDVGDQVKILVHVGHRQAGQFSGRGDDQVWDGRRAMLTLIG